MPAATTTPVSETPNALSMGIDTCPPDEIVSIMSSVDEQIFTGFEAYPSLNDDTVIRTIEGMSEAAARCISQPNSCVVVSGAGTSGRFAFMICETFNRAITKHRQKMHSSTLVPEQPSIFMPLCAGGSNALCESLELVEDDPEVSRNDLLEAIRGRDAVFYIGVTCGLSAPYVAGQLSFLLDLKEGKLNDASVPGGQETLFKCPLDVPLYLVEASLQFSALYCGTHAAGKGGQAGRSCS